jgi:hypothetical protein
VLPFGWGTGLLQTVTQSYHSLSLSQIKSGHIGDEVDRAMASPQYDQWHGQCAATAHPVKTVSWNRASTLLGFVDWVKSLRPARI